MSLQIEATVKSLEKIPAYGTEFRGVRISAEDGNRDTIWIPLAIELGMIPPKIGDTLRVEATWGPINVPFPEDEDLIGTTPDGDVIGEDPRA